MKFKVRQYFDLSPFLVFLPVGLLYVVIVWVFHRDDFYGDELRYVTFAQNLLHGFYSPSPPNINLWSGPGYPLVILPFVWLKLPLIFITMLNACFQYLSVVLLFMTLREYVPKRLSYVFSCFWALYYPAYLWEMPLIYSESLTILLIVACAFALMKSRTQTGSEINKWLIIFGCLFGFLVLTKIIFGYVLLLLFSGSLFLFFFKQTLLVRKLLFSLIFALLVNVPYLIYTHSLTGKLFYWGNSGGENLYWMTTPYAGEYGEWHGLEILDQKNANTSLVKNHIHELKEIWKFQGVERDDYYKAVAISNIKNYPIKYLRNCLANVSRLLFDTPLYFASPTDLFLLRILPSCFLLPFILVSMLVILFNFNVTPLELRILFLITLLYFTLAVLVSAYNRHFYILIPTFLMFIAYVYESFLGVRMNEKE